MNGDEQPDERQAAEALEAYVARLLADRAPAIPQDLDREELRAYLLAGELAGLRLGAADPPEEVQARLTARLDDLLAHPAGTHRAGRPGQRRLNRRQGLSAVAGMAAGVLIGVAVDRGVPGLDHSEQPGHPQQMELVGPNGRWYDVAALAVLPEGAVRRFSAGAVDGYLINEGGQVRALSAICTHMGCHLQWHGMRDRFECLCHGAVFSRQGAVVGQGPLAALPPIQVRVQRGRVYVWGTAATQWG